MRLAIPVVALAVAAVVSAALTGWVRWVALQRTWLDVPNARSSHSVPTPRGGGLAIVAVTLGGVALGWALGIVPTRAAAGMLGGGTLVALAGWIDDRRHLTPLARAAAQCLAAVWVLAWLGWLPSLWVGAGSSPLGWAGAVIGVLVVMWSVNLFNFMDGIDGIAGAEALVVGAAGTALAFWRHDPALAFVSAVMAGAALGFLRWNWAPARIFMGDVGSGFLGFMFAALALMGERQGSVPLLAWILLGGVFVFDATVTLHRRMLRGERWHAPHRTHAYQRAVDGGLTHAQVAGGVLVLDLGLAALAWLALARDGTLGWTGLVAAVTLAALYYWIGRRTPPATETTR
jgi:Fuc2NAc and GlcNAc transferase